MPRVAKKAAAPVAKEIEEEAPTITQTRSRRTPKPNPKYTSELLIAPPKIDSDASDADDKEGEKPTKSVKKEAATPKPKTPAAKAKAAAAIKKQKLEYDDEAEKETDDASEEGEKPAARATRSGKGNDSLKVGNESVAIIDVSSIIGKAESPKPTRAAGRKRAVAEPDPPKEDAKKKKEEDKPSLITARKSYMPSPALAKKTADAKIKPIKDEMETNEEPEEVKKEPMEVVKTPATTRTRRNAGEAPQSEIAEKKVKVEESPAPAAEVKKLPTIRPVMTKQTVTPAVKSPLPIVKSELPVGKTSPVVRSPGVVVKSATVTVKSPTAVLPTKTINNNLSSTPKPVPRILNSMITPRGKQSPNVKLAGDGSDKKVFSIDLTEDAVKEEKKMIVVAQVKTPAKLPVAVKENIAFNKPPPSTVLKNKLESELIRMKASANMSKRQGITYARQYMPAQAPPANAAFQQTLGARRITKFESWYVIDVKNVDPSPFKHTHTSSLIKFGNIIKDLQLPSSKWDYKVTLQRRMPKKENNNEEEVYTGDVTDKSVEADKANFEPSSILFKRNYREANKITIDRSLMLKQNMYTITMNGKQCKLIGAPGDIKSGEDIELLLSIIDSSSPDHSCVEVVTNPDVITIH